ncbi:hypothetical protein FHS85_004997 [Rhodoligotrophos appendicifer]|uniref:DUF3341 domain-containing protein n=1 Tax=Rhodoligotrophos appendicifer TaxID=987056 RepID=UPI0011850414|nr:DUF3341 domain-containing protein [Rhodoligotrophos appendicifer]
MREPTPHEEVFGLLAEFDDPDALKKAVHKSCDAGYRCIDAYTPFPIEGLAEAMGFKDRRVAWLTLAGGFLGAATGYGLQVYTNLDFPIDIGGRPLIAWPAFMLITFEVTVLFAVLFSIFGMLALNHLPRLHHPIFDIPEFHLASYDKFFLVLFSTDEKFDRESTRGFLEGLDPVTIVPVEHTEEPE